MHSVTDIIILVKLYWIIHDLLIFFLHQSFGYGDQSDRVTSDLVSISVIKSIYVLVGTISGKLMGRLESCQPLKKYKKKLFFKLILTDIFLIIYFY